MWLLAVVLAALCIERAAADSLIPAEVSEAVPPEAAQLMADVGDAPEQSLWQGLRGLWTAAQDYVAQALHQRLSGAVVLLGVVLLCSVAESFFAAAEQPSVPRYVSMAGAMAITLTAAGDFKQLMGLGVETLEELDIFAKALLPTLSAAVAASGGMVSRERSRWPPCFSPTCCSASSGRCCCRCCTAVSWPPRRTP